MDSTRLVKTFDTTITKKDTLIKHTATVETISKSDCKFNWCDCKLLSDLIWPVTILIIIALFYRKISRLLGHISDRAKKFKLGGLEIELEDLWKQAENVEKTISDTGLKFKGPGGEKDPMDFDYVITSDLPVEILRLSLEIERTLRKIYDLTAKETSKKPLAVSALIETLRENRILNMEQTTLLRQFWIFRNSIVHAVKYNVTELEFISFIDIGIKILKILRSIENKSDNPTMDTVK
jgi:hypothetical protein